jgi:hypothetical protein
MLTSSLPVEEMYLHRRGIGLQPDLSPACWELSQFRLVSTAIVVPPGLTMWLGRMMHGLNVSGSDAVCFRK